MMKNLKIVPVHALILITSVVWISKAQDAAAFVIDDFEVNEVFEGRDEFNNAIGHAPWGDVAGNVVLGVAQSERVDVSSSVLEIKYDIGGWGGFTHAFTDGDNWISHNWTSHNALSFWLYGNNTGGMVQIEIFDNRNPNLNTDTAERWFNRITDDYDGWLEFSISFRSFQRRTDWQPGGAPSDGLGLNEVSDYAFGFPAGTGPQTAYLDNIQLVSLGVDPLAVNDFEMDEILLGQDSFGNNIGFVSWGDTAENIELRLFEATRGGEKSTALTINYDIAAWGGFTHAFTDGDNWISHDWTSHNALSFWLSGNNTGQIIQVELFDNRAPDGNADTAERFFFHVVDDYEAWQQFTIPFAHFQRRSDWQPGGAPDDGCNLDAVNGFAFGFPAGVGANFSEVGWPLSGEKNVVYGALHGPGYSGVGNLGHAYRSDVNFDEGFHVYAIDWDEHVIRWYVDGELASRISVNALDGKQWVYDHDFFLLMNVAVGGYWPGYPDETTEFPQEMLVDYVRVYQLKSE